MKVVRLITYEIPDDFPDAEAVMQKQLESSYPNGVEVDRGKVKIQVDHVCGPTWPTDGRRILGEVKQQQRMQAFKDARAAHPCPACKGTGGAGYAHGDSSYEAPCKPCGGTGIETGHVPLDADLRVEARS